MKVNKSKSNRNVVGRFFKVSGFTQMERDDIWVRTPIIKEVLKSIKLKKRQENQLINYINAAYQRFTEIDHAKKVKKGLSAKRERVSRQIQNGFDVAKKWKDEYDRQSEQEKAKPDNEAD